MSAIKNLKALDPAAISVSQSGLKWKMNPERFGLDSHLLTVSDRREDHLGFKKS